MLSFQSLDVYRCAIEFVTASADLPTDLPRGYAALGDQLRRAALSVPLNIAEASGRPSEADAARHFGIARGSAMECAAIVDTLLALHAISPSRHAVATTLLGRIVSMLTKLSRIQPDP